MFRAFALERHVVPTLVSPSACERKKKEKKTLTGSPLDDVAKLLIGSPFCRVAGWRHGGW